MKPPSRFFAPVLAALALVLASCGSPPEWPHGHGGDGAAMPASPVMSGQTTLAGGTLVAEATLGRGFSGAHIRPDGSRPERHMGPPERLPGPAEEAEARSRQRISMNHPPPMPPVRLKLHFTNQGTEALDVLFEECSSSLGNFGISPERALLAPGQSFDPDAMTSLLGVTGEDIPVTITVRIKGKREQATLTLKAAAPSAP